MKIKCMAEYYKYKEKGTKIVVFNSLYDSNLFTLFISAILEVCIPDIKSFCIPLAIEIEIDDSKDVIIDKKLIVSGTDSYKYFIPKEHYLKWKKTYRMASWFIIAVEAIVSFLLLYIYIVLSQFNSFVGMAFIFVVSITIIFVYKFYKQNKQIKKYSIKEL